MEEKLTQKQKNIIKEIEKVNEILSLDYKNIFNYGKSERTVNLLRMKDQLIRGRVILWYTWIDYQLNYAIVYDCFKERGANFFKTKKHERFNHCILEKLNLLQKFEYISAASKKWKNHSKVIYSLNDLRNGLAHSLYPEKRLRSKPIYRGHNIYSVEGLRKFEEDMTIIYNLY